VELEEFEAFFEFMRPRLMGTALRSLDVDTANEVAIAALHTIWTKNVEAPRNNVEQLQLQALTYRVLEGNVRNALRSRARRARLLEAVVDREQTARTNEPDVADSLDWQEDERSIDALLGALSESERQVVTLVLDGFKVNEIAEMLGRRPGAISMRLNRARKQLRRTLGRRDDESRA
jgi:RNA polymerase sigma factor (sigma-70 family)